jgi:hypothetical protein
MGLILFWVYIIAYNIIYTIIFIFFNIKYKFNFADIQVKFL